MGAVAPVVVASGPRLLRRGFHALAIAVGAVLLAAALAALLYRYPPPVVVVAGVGAGLLGVLALALARYELAVGLGVVLLGVARYPLDPSDAVFAVVIAVALATGRFRPSKGPRTVTILIGAFLALNVLAMVEVKSLGRAVAFFPITVYLGVFALWLATYATSTSRVRSLVRAYVFAAVVSAALGSLALVAAIPARELLAFHGERARGFFEDPNVFGPFLVPAALILLEELIAPRLLRSGRMLKALMFGTVTLGILLCASRAAWFGLALGVAVVLAVLSLRRGGARRATALIVVLTATAVVLGAAVELTGSAGFLESRAQLQSYDADRFGAQRAGLEFAAEYPLGVGPGQFEEFVPLAAHSTYVRVLAEEGVLGLAVLVALMLVTLWLAARNAVAGRDTYGIGSGTLLGAWCGLLVTGAVVDTLHFRILWVVAALIWAGAARPGRPVHDPVAGRA